MEFETWLNAMDFDTNVSPHIESQSTKNSFETWFTANGGYMNPLVESASDPARGNFLRVKPGCTILTGSAIVSCPHTLALSWPSAQKFHYPGIKLPSCTQYVASRFFLMKQKILKENSPWWPYVQILPETFNTPPYYDAEDFAWIRGSNLGRACELRDQTWRAEYDGMINALLIKGMTDEQKELWSWDLYLWAATIMTSRCFPGPAVFNQIESQHSTYNDEPEGIAPVVIPGLDILNHVPSSRVAWLWDSTTCTIKTDDILLEGSEVPNNYGAKSNEELIMGYGFSLENNPADCFSIGFSPAINAYIEAEKACRSITADESWHNAKEPVNEKAPIAAGAGSHWVCIQDMKPRFSTDFVENFSIAIENPRERRKAEVSQLSDTDLAHDHFTRNKLHTICAIFMILQRGQFDIRKHDSDIPEHPRNFKQLDAARYRQKQLDILDHALKNLAERLTSLCQNMDGRTNVRVIRLEHIIENGPKWLLKDVRSVLNSGMKTRDPLKIRKRGGTDFAFTIWLCGLWLSQQSKVEQHHADRYPLENHLIHWLQSLLSWYPSNENGLHKPAVHPDGAAESDRALWFDPVRNSAGGEDTRAEIDSTVTSYLDAINATIQKHPQSLFNSVEVNIERLAWCYTMVRNEGVWFPNLIDKEDDEDDEWVLVIESQGCDQQTMHDHRNIDEEEATISQGAV